MKHRLTSLLAALALLTAPVAMVSCESFTKQDAAEYAVIAAEQALLVAKMKLAEAAGKPDADPLKIAALTTAVLTAERALDKAKERLAAPPAMALPITSAK